MKTSKKIAKYILITSLALSFLACKKNAIVDEISKVDIQRKQIQEIIPAHYLDSLKKLGLVINVGITPVNVEGY